MNQLVWFVQYWSQFDHSKTWSSPKFFFLNLDSMPCLLSDTELDSLQRGEILKVLPMRQHRHSNVIIHTPLATPKANVGTSSLREGRDVCNVSTHGGEIINIFYLWIGWFDGISQTCTKSCLYMWFGGTFHQVSLSSINLLPSAPNLPRPLTKIEYCTL